MNKIDLDNLRSDRDAIERALREAGAHFVNAKSIKCPFHEDRTPSGNIYRGDDGAWRFKCHAAGCAFCGDVIDVRARASGRKPEDVIREMVGRDFPPTRRASPPPVDDEPRAFSDLDALKSAFRKAEATYSYTNPSSGTPDLIVFRIREADGRKRFIQASPARGGGFVLKKGAGLAPIYNRSRIAKAAKVVVVEGEKCVHALAEVSIVATTSPGGAGKASLADWSPLAGKTVYLWPDHDAVRPETGKSGGAEHMREVAEILQRLNPPPRVLSIDAEILGLDADGSDVVDYIASYGGDTPATRATAVHAALSLAQSVGGASDLYALIEDTIAGRRRTIAFPWSQTTRLSRALMPGSVTCLCGDPGAGKSLMILEAAMWWHMNGLKVAVRMLEDDRAYHLNRVLAQVEQHSDLCDPEWVLRNPDVTRAAVEKHRQLIDSFAPRLTADDAAELTHRELIEWLRREAAAGARVIVIDPVTAAAVSDKPWLDDLKFLMEAKRIVRQFGCSLVLTTHPRKGKRSNAMLDDLAGGSAYPRFSQTVMWLVKHDEPQDVKCAGPCGVFSTSINRSLRLGKTRNGPGGGTAIGFQFEGSSLRFSEQGVIVKDGATRNSEVADPFSNEVA